jgi:hypothetical protein
MQGYDFGDGFRIFVKIVRFNTFSGFISPHKC